MVIERMGSAAIPDMQPPRGYSELYARSTRNGS
jgi:hypothetical protein